MNLENIAGYSIGSFVTGAVVGAMIDRRINYINEINECFNEEKKDPKLNELTEQLRQQVRKVEKDMSVIPGYFSFGIDLLRHNGLINALLIGGISAASAYAGIKTGECISKILRNKSRLNDEEKQILDNYLKRINSLDGDSIKTFDELNNYIVEIAKKKKNANLGRGLVGLIEKKARSVIIKHFFENDKGYICMHPLPEKRNYDETRAIILHENELYSCVLGMENFERIVDDDKNQTTEFVYPKIVDEGKLNWNNSLDGLLEIVENHRDNRNILLVRTNPESPLFLKRMMALDAYSASFSARYAESCTN